MGQRRRRHLKQFNGTSTCEEEQWTQLGVPGPVIRALLEQGIRIPTEIQRRAIAAALREQCDIIGAAETVRVTPYHTLPLPSFLP